ncbi:MAG: SDR family NAD(P)-dependent oxidoreductase [Legionellaceae bacterium]|nr:SDR family NAD(P)-dependent oxidoreductase [Legionellaceae bacterium]
MRIIKATLATLAAFETVKKDAPNALFKLFNDYRVFYKQPSDITSAKRFILERLKKEDSLILLAFDESTSSDPLGFLQIYPSFSSVAAKKIFILNDLYVDPQYRRAGVAGHLLDAAKQQATAQGVSKLVLETAKDNHFAQSLYERAGYTKESSDFLTYSLPVPVVNEDELMSSSVLYERNGRKLVVITGVTSGLGRAMLDRFNELGWMVAGCGRSVEEIAKLKRQYGHQHYFERVDIADENAVMFWSQHVDVLCGGEPDLLINNASIVNQSARTWEISPSEFSRVMTTNVLGSVNVIHYFVPMMMKNQRGIIINISSGWGREGDASVSAYCASKFAIEGLSQSMAKELPEGMAVITLDPRDGVATSMLHQCASPEYVKMAPSADAWSRTAVPFILGLTPADNGKALTCPEVDMNQEDKKKVGIESSSAHFLWSNPHMKAGDIPAVIEENDSDNAYR